MQNEIRFLFIRANNRNDLKRKFMSMINIPNNNNYYKVIADQMSILSIKMRKKLDNIMKNKIIEDHIKELVESNEIENIGKILNINMDQINSFNGEVKKIIKVLKNSFFKTSVYLLIINTNYNYNIDYTFNEYRRGINKLVKNTDFSKFDDVLELEHYIDINFDNTNGELVEE